MSETITLHLISSLRPSKVSLLDLSTSCQLTVRYLKGSLKIRSFQYSKFRMAIIVDVSFVMFNILAKQLIYGDWLEFYKGYWPLRHRPNFHFVVYEEAKSDIRKTVTDLARFLDVPLSDALLNDICRLVDFNNMKGHQNIDVKEFQGQFIRKGKVGAWRETLTLQQSADVDAMYDDAIKEMGLPVHYDEI